MLEMALVCDISIRRIFSLWVLMILVTRWDEISGDGGENSVWRSLYVCAYVCVCAD